MKAPAREARRRPPRTRERVRAYSAYMYKAHKEVSPAGRKGPHVLGGRFGLPGPVVLRLVSLEASRLSRSNRRKVLTVREINAAATHVRQRINARAAA